MSINGITTLNICHSLKRLNITIGKDIGLIGFDDTNWAAIIGDGISTLKQPIAKIGLSAVQLLLKRIQGNQSSCNTIRHKGALIIRGSTTY
ncbi:substrate-binding domain-containing protein [Necropsobacter rosorum]|uniref:substrate-binding domain-containing protein n=1 Tax=Necropsobacter rosorum TaxID=908285 RepID=UPI003C7EAC4D